MTFDLYYEWLTALGVTAFIFICIALGVGLVYYIYREFTGDE